MYIYIPSVCVIYIHIHCCIYVCVRIFVRRRGIVRAATADTLLTHLVGGKSLVRSRCLYNVLN